ncbi:NinE family protein [Escherichia coli]|nr:NinE family protein [Escherichia coli]
MSDLPTGGTNETTATKYHRHSITDIICENCKYLPTKRSRNKRKPIPKESDVKTFNYTAHLWDIRWLRYRARK